jgi:hypothetical protein
VDLWLWLEFRSIYQLAGTKRCAHVLLVLCSGTLVFDSSCSLKYISDAGTERLYICANQLCITRWHTYMQILIQSGILNTVGVARTCFLISMYIPS